MFIKDYKPYCLNDFFGQSNVKKEVLNMSKEMKFPNSMFMSGITGGGKTTIANIIAMLLNCERPVKEEDRSYSPCKKCPSCKSVINETYDMDIMFKDCSQMGKEDVINLENSVSSAPIFGKNKVLILDEAQELSLKAKGVTLKLLEKKRNNIYFILCTMHPNSFDRAIIDRCHSFNFVPYSVTEIMDCLFYILDDKIDKELPDTVQTEIIPKIADTIAQSGGSMREAVQTFEKCIIGEVYTEAELEISNDFVSIDNIYNLFIRFMRNDLTALMEINKINKKHFYNLGKKILLDVYLKKICGVLESERDKNIGSIDNLDGLIDIFTEYNQYNFNDSRFMYKLISFMKNMIDIPKTSHIESKKVKRVKRQ